MNTKKILMILSLAAALFSAARTASAAASGDIVEIRAVDVDGEMTFGPYMASDPNVCSVDNPIRVGQEVYFRVRMMVKNYVDVIAGGDDPETWSFHFTGIGSETLNAPALGLYIGNHPAYATYVTQGPNWWQKSGSLQYDEAGNLDGAKTYYTDLYFCYQVQPGDIGLPVKLMNKNGKPADSEESTTDYCLHNVNDMGSSPSFILQSTTGTAANFNYGPGWLTYYGYGATWPEHDKDGAKTTPQVTYDLVTDGVYVKTVDFDEYDAEGGKWTEGEIWRTVYQGSSEVPVIEPSIIIPGGSEVDENNQVWVWTTNSAAKPVGTGAKTVTKGGSTAYALPLTITKGSESVAFSLMGDASAAIGTEVDLFLGPSMSDIFDASGRPIMTDVSRKLKIVSAPPPFVKITVGGESEATFTPPLTDHSTAVGTIQVTLSQAFTADVSVNVDVSLPTAPAKDWKKYIGLSQYATGGITHYTTNVTFRLADMESGTLTQTLRLYALGSDDSTKAAPNGVQIKPLVQPLNGADAFYSYNAKNVAANVYLKTTNPIITEPEPLQVFTGAQGKKPYAFTLKIQDTYKNLTDANGYEIQFKSGEAGSSYVTIPCEENENKRWTFSTDGELNENGGAFDVTYNAVNDETVTSEIQVIGPDGKTKSIYPGAAKAAPVKVYVTVEGANSVSATVTTKNWNEGDVVPVNFKLKKSQGVNLYAFLKPYDSITNLVSGDGVILDGTAIQGAEISAGDTESTGQVYLRLLDGKSSELSGTSLSFDIVLCTTEEYSETTVFSEVGSTKLTLKSYNVEPKVVMVQNQSAMSVEWTSSTDVPLMGKVSKGTEQTFELANVTKMEPGVIDRDSLSMRWKVQEFDANGSQVTGMTTNFTGKISDAKNKLVHTFSTQGYALITVYLHDKDMEDYGSGYQFRVDVMDAPTIEVVETTTHFAENSPGQVTFRLTDSIPDSISVRVTVTTYSDPGTKDAGRFILDQTKLEDPTKTVKNVYLITLGGSVLSDTLTMDELDGTSFTESQGYRIATEVIGDAVHPGSGKKYKDYLTQPGGRIYIDNVAPTVSAPVSNGPLADDEKGYSAGLGLNEARTIYFTIKGDVAADEEAKFSTMFICTGGGGMLDGTEYTGATKLAVGDHTFVPRFESQGSHTIEMQVQDKDKANAESTTGGYIWYYFVDPAKTLTLIAHGPNGGTTTSLSQKYKTAKVITSGVGGGIGEGHVAAPVSGGSAKSWTLTYNYGTAKTANFYGFGYKVGAIDDGTLDGGGYNDVAIDKSGNSASLNFYEYADTYDSFLYAWISIAAGDDKNVTGTLVGTTISPECVEQKPTLGVVALPDELPDDGSYEETRLEAVFSREWLKSDNMGDMNGDGIPDRMVLQYALADFATEGADLANAAALNDDADVLPLSPSSVLHATGSSATNDTSSASNSVAATVAGQLPFTAIYEIRGYHRGLNIPGVTEMDMSDAERRAFKRYLKKLADGGSADEAVTKAVAAFVPAGTTDPALFAAETVALTNAFAKGYWTPENATDPTKDDTDGDGLNDGYEYYYWYSAHVLGATGERYGFFNGNLNRPTVITSETIASLFNPNSLRNWGSGETDTDGDGLSDLEEYAIGTNPVHWDSDGDGVPDGWEVLRGTNPLAADSTGDSGNPDGDFMARETVGDQLVIEIETAQNGVTNIVPWGCDNYLKKDETTGKTLYRYQMVAAEDAEALPDGYVLLAKDDDGAFKAPTYYFAGDEAELAKYADDLQVIAEMPVTEIFTTTVEDEDGKKTKCYWRGASTTLKAGLLLSTPAEYDDIGQVTKEAEATFKWGTTADYRVCVPAIVKTADAESESTIPSATNLSGCVQLYRYGGNDGPFAVKMSCKLDPSPKAKSEIQGTVTYYGGSETNSVSFWTNATVRIVGVATAAEVNYLHAQVFARNGFDPRTGWGRCEHGYCGARWCKICSGSEELKAGDSGLAANTSAYTTKDEYLAMQYAYESGIAKLAEDLAKVNAKSKTIVEVWKERTTKPTDAETPANAADTDGDSVADGWELYVLKDPNSSEETDTADDDWGILAGKNGVDGDGLKLAAEFAGTDVYLAYADCETIGPNIDSWIWFNKFFPSNPYAADTDGDGLTDSEERACDWEINYLANVQYTGTTTDAEAGTVIKTSFIYGANSGNGDFGYATDGGETCVRGGGLNPCSVDTDGDRLPDLWEYQFAGRWVESESGATAGGYIDFGMDGTDAYDAYTFKRGSKPIEKGKDPRTGTWRNFDFDVDGLENWQEYLVQSLRHFRYDVARMTTTDQGGTSPLTVEGLTAETPMYYVSEGLVPKIYDFVFGPAKAEYALPADDATRRGFFGSSPHAWDPNDLRTDNKSSLNRIMLTPGSDYLLTNEYTKATSYDIARGYIAASQYASTDPRMRDTDQDGIDDFYELYHGLNPILGGDYYDSTHCRDVIAEAYGPTAFCGMPITCYRNIFTDPTEKDSGGELALKSCALDFVKYPYLAGLSSADPDGDGLRNEDEKIEVNTTSPAPSNTDPTPLWMTDSSFPYSYTARYYVRGSAIWSMWAHSLNSDLDNGGSMLFSFEMNEGYDTDDDGYTDAEEAVRTVLPASDSLRFTDPSSRQALYFPGDAASAAITLQPGYQASSLVKVVREKSKSVSGGDFFRQFTVEMWVKPEAVNDATIVERICLYPSSNKNSSDVANDAQVEYVRANFRVGIRDGRFYAMMDNTDARESGSNMGISSARVISTVETEAGKWYHVAATFDGSEIAIIVNRDGDTTRYGTRTAETLGAGFVVANGVYAVLQQVNDAYPIYAYEIYPSAMVMGASADKIGLDPISGYGDDTPTPANYTQHFKGYVSDVRVWDGVRSLDQIAENFDKRLSYDEIIALRDEAYQQWLLGATRSSTDGAAMMPAELIFHYTMDGLHGATEPQYVATTPMAFQLNVVSPAATTLGSDVYVGWLDTIRSYGLGSTVYTSRSYVPWVKNQISRLPIYDGSVADSVYWGENLAGDHTAESVSVEKFGFPRTANPYAYACNVGDIGQRLLRYRALQQATGTNELSEASAIGTLLKKYYFDLRTRHTQPTDLVPLGGVFAKRDTDYWDGNGAMDADVLTSDGSGAADAKGNGLPDWWEQYCRDNYFEGMGYDPGMVLTLDTKVNRLGQVVTASEAYLSDILVGMLPNATVLDAYADRVDSDGDGVLDVYVEKYHLAADEAGLDYDGDGLSNYAEYLITEVFKYASCDPDQYATDGNTCDYYKKVGDLYLGEIFTDHDRMTDVWEAQFDSDYVNRYVYDADGDPDNDGWSNFAEFRAGTDPSSSAKIGVGEYTAPQYPIPVVEAKVSYNGKDVLLSKVVFQAWNEESDFDMTSVPDAIWTIGNGEADDGESSSGSTSSESASTLTAYEKYLGKNPGSMRTIHLSGGSVSPGSVEIDFLDLGYVKHTTTNIVKGADATWFMGVTDKNGVLVDFATNAVGTVDYETGIAKVDFSKFTGSAIGNESQGTLAVNPGTYRMTEYAEWDEISLDDSHVLVKWSAKKVGLTAGGTYYLSDPDAVTSSSKMKSHGHLKEGKTTFICFIDEDDSGTYTVGELFGTVRGVDVGWDRASLSLELTETHPIFARVSLTDGSSDRLYYYSGSDGSTISNITDGTDVEMPEGRFMRVRVDRYAVNGVKLGTSSDEINIINSVLIDKWFYDGARQFLHEGDFISADCFDLDWEYFGVDILQSDKVKKHTSIGGDPTEVSYRIVIDNNAFVGANGENRTLSFAFTRSFDSVFSRNVATNLNSIVCYSARPVFKWRMTNNSNTYTAFRVRITDADTGEITYESPMALVPVVDANGYYAWESAVAAGAQTPQGKILKACGNYEWQVSMYNAKFQTDKWSVKAPLVMAVGQQQYTDDHAYHTLNVAVKYAGPASVLSNCTQVSSTAAKVRVQAFETPDFSGSPIAEALVTNLVSLTDTEDVSANARLIGMPTGLVYIRAFIDSDGDFARSDWESWGLADGAVTLAPGQDAPTVTVWIEDSDTDQDWIPDVWEYVHNGTLTSANAMVQANGAISMKSQTYNSMMAGVANFSTYLSGASLTLFENLYAAQGILGFGSSPVSQSIAVIRESLQRKIKDGTLRIAAFSMDASGKVTLVIGADVAAPDTAASRLFSPIYELTTPTVVTVKIYKKNTLIENWPTIPEVTKTVQIQNSLYEQITLDTGLDMSSGFFKVEVDEEDSN